MECLSFSDRDNYLSYAEHVLRDNSPSIDEFDDYLAAKRSSLQEGNLTWVVKNIAESARRFDLLSPERGTIVAGVAAPDFESGMGATLHINADEIIQVEVQHELEAFRERIDPYSARTKEVEMQIFGYALKLAEVYARD